MIFPKHERDDATKEAIFRHFLAEVGETPRIAAVNFHALRRTLAQIRALPEPR